MAQHSKSNRKTSEIPILEENLSKNFPNFKRPNICGYFSINKHREYVPDISQLKYFYYPGFDANHKCFLDLNKGIDKRIKKPEDLDEKIDHLLHFILDNYHNLHDPYNEQKLLLADFVCYRGILTHMMDSLYHDDQWSLLVTNWKGTFYLSEIKNKPNYNMPKHKMDMFCSWGYKFEQYLLTDKFNTLPDLEEPVIESEEFCAVFQTKLNNKNLIYGAEMDGIVSKFEITDPVNTWSDIEFIEIKTNRKIDSYKQEYNLRRHKFIKWWAQSFLVGIEKLYCGFRDDNGIVINIEEYLVKDLPKNACQWQANIAMNLCDRFLDIIRDTIPSSVDPNVTWRVEWKQKNGGHCIETWVEEKEKTILPKWYTERILKLV